MTRRAPPPAGPLRRLGTLPVAEFVRRYWQRRPLCIRQALGAFTPPLDPAALFALAADPDVESRLVAARAAGKHRWQLRHGPFEADELPPRKRPGWTLLVQGVDLHDAAVAALAERFRFLPAARYDDVMISYATDGGGVGPHVDQYDVFLLQAQGRRRWRIARDFDPALVPGLPLRVLANFRHEQEWLLEPGDALYLPPGVAHEGVAQGECMTVSVGFRLPAWREIAEAWSEHQARQADDSADSSVRGARVPDTTRRPTAAPARLPAAMIDVVARELRRRVPTRRQAGRTLLEHLTEPKPNVVFAAPRRALGAERFAAQARSRGVALDRRTRMLFAGSDFAINGELVPAPRALAAALRGLANRRRLDAAALPAQGRPGARELFALLQGWHACGWLHFAV